MSVSLRGGHILSARRLKLTASHSASTSVWMGRGPCLPTFPEDRTWLSPELAHEAHLQAPLTAAHSECGSAELDTGSAGQLGSTTRCQLCSTPLFIVLTAEVSEDCPSESSSGRRWRKPETIWRDSSSRWKLKPSRPARLVSSSFSHCCCSSKVWTAWDAPDWKPAGVTSVNTYGQRGSSFPPGTPLLLPLECRVFQSHLAWNQTSKALREGQPLRKMVWLFCMSST